MIKKAIHQNICSYLNAGHRTTNFRAQGLNQFRIHKNTLYSPIYRSLIQNNIASFCQQNNNHKPNTSLTISQKIYQYHLLCRNDKPIGTMLLYWPTAWGVVLGAMSVHTMLSFSTLYLLGLFFMGSWTSRSAGCIINDIFDREFDKKVQRTKSRPLAAGTVSLKEAIGLLFANLLGGLIVLFHLPFNALMFTFGIVALAGLYPLAKRFTYYPQIVLGVGFNSGIIIAALTTNPSLSLAYLLPFYLTGICWTMIYDTVYAYQDIQDDLKIGVKSTAIAWRDHNPMKIMQMIGWFITVVHGILPLIDFDLWVTSTMLVASDLELMRKLRTIDLSDRGVCGAFFKFNNYYGFWVFISLILGGIYYQSRKQKQEGQKILKFSK